MIEREKPGEKVHNNRPIIFLPRYRLGTSQVGATDITIVLNSLSSLGKGGGECKCTFHSLLLAELITNLWREVARKEMESSQLDARRKQKFVVQIWMLIFLLPFFSLSLWLLLERYAEVYEACRAEMMPLYFSVLNTAARYCVSPEFLSRNPTTLFQGLALSEIPVD